MKHFALFVTTKQSAHNFSAPPPRRGREKIFFARASLVNAPAPINIFVILTLLTGWTEIAGHGNDR